MDSMRSLNRSLPRSSPHHSRRHTVGDIAQAFRAAALSVTQLYKAAATDIELSRAAGYQDALDELLIFLDRENLGLDDGEGWRVRQWATERLSPGLAGTDSDAEIDDAERARSESPLRANTTGPDEYKSASPLTTDAAQTQRAGSAPLPAASDDKTSPDSQPAVETFQRPDMFHFTSHPHFPDDTEMDMANLDVSLNPLSFLRSEQSLRPLRASHRHSLPNSRERKLGLASFQPLGLAAGSKRKSSFNDLFDISALGNSKGLGAGSGGGGSSSGSSSSKKSRMV